MPVLRCCLAVAALATAGLAGAPEATCQGAEVEEAALVQRRPEAVRKGPGGGAVHELPPRAPASQAALVRIPPPPPCDFTTFSDHYCYYPVMSSPFDTAEEAKSSCLCDTACEGVYDSAGVAGWSGKAYLCKSDAGRSWSNMVQGYQGVLHWKGYLMFTPSECSEYWAATGQPGC